MEPTPHVIHTAPRPAESRLRRAFQTIFVERRMPYRIGKFLDNACVVLGRRLKLVRSQGMCFRVRRLTCDEVFVRSIIEEREYTPAGFEIGESDTVVDIGGNIGTFAILASRAAHHGRVFTFEPNSENYSLLQQNIALNRAGNITAINAAVARTNGELKLYCSKQGGFHSLARNQRHVSEETVRAVSLQSIFDEFKIEHCNFLKVDCEGAEYEILGSASRELLSRIDMIALEYHDDGVAGQVRADQLVEHLQANSFSIDTYTKLPGHVNGWIRARRLRDAVAKT